LKVSDCGGINLIDGGRAAVIVASKWDSTIMLWSIIHVFIIEFILPGYQFKAGLETI
jgi:hypothetical protein